MTIPYGAVSHPAVGSPAQDYIDAVVSCVPWPAEQQRIEAELRARVDPGMTAEQASATYGQPREVAELYLASVHLESASFFRRVAAALIDIPSVILSGLLFFYLAWKVIVPGDSSSIAAVFMGNPVAVILCVVTAVLMSPAYYIIAETRTSQTVGKALMGLRTVSESGTKISVGQAMVRQIPFVASIYLLDAAFALFTSKKQRLFEIISRTRVVRA